MKVYVVTSGCFEDYHIEAIFSTKAKAEKFIKHIGHDEDEGPWVEAWDVDEYDKELSKKGHLIYYVRTNKKGKVLEAHPELKNYADIEKPIISNSGKTMKIWVYARHKQHAIKIADDIRHQLMASGKLIAMITAVDLLKKPWALAKRCQVCHSDPDNPTWEQLPNLLRCPVCNADIVLRGRYSSDGWGYLSALYKKHPDDPRWTKIIPFLDDMINYSSWKKTLDDIPDSPAHYISLITNLVDEGL